VKITGSHDSDSEQTDTYKHYLLSLSSWIPLLQHLSLKGAPNLCGRRCVDVVVFFARGTTESGTLGTIIDPGFQTALRRTLGMQSLSFTGIDYHTTIVGFLAGRCRRSSNDGQQCGVNCQFLPEHEDRHVWLQASTPLTVS